MPVSVATTHPLSPLSEPNVIHQKAFTFLTQEFKPSFMVQKDRFLYLQTYPSPPNYPSPARKACC